MKNMTPKEREHLPTAQFGERYNVLLELGKEVAPDADERLWPTHVAFESFHPGGQRLATSRYVEIETYVRQIESLMPQEF